MIDSFLLSIYYHFNYECIASVPLRQTTPFEKAGSFSHTGLFTEYT